MRILIVEEALRLGNGHWPRYIADLAEGFRKEGDIVDILGHREANEKVKSVVHSVVPWLSRDCRADTRSQGLIGGIRHNFSLKRELAAWLHGRESYDWILSLSSRPKHLLAFAMLVRETYCIKSRLLLLFVISPGRQDEAGKFRLSASNLFAKFCFALLRPAVQRGQVVIAAETKGMQVAIEQFSGLPAILFPHPVEFPMEMAEEKAQKLKKDLTTEIAAVPELQATGRLRGQVGAVFSNPFASELASDSENTWFTRFESESCPFSATIYSMKNSVPGALSSQVKPLLVVAPGLARYEKGSDIFQEAIKLFLKEHGNEWPVKFVIQWQEDFDLPNGRRCGPDSDLLKDERVEFSRDLLTGEAYMNFLRRADVIVLPYRSKSYRARVSRVAIEAAMLGKPMVYTTGTWIHEVASMVGVGKEVDEQGAEALATQIHEVLAQISSLQIAASQGADRVRDFYSVKKFRANLLKIG